MKNYTGEASFFLELKLEQESRRNKTGENECSKNKKA